MANEHISGLSAVLVQDNEIIWYGNYGLADRTLSIPVSDSTIFMLASVSKTIMATALMQLVENGLVGMDDDVNDHLSFSVRNPNYPDSAITVKQLLTHTSSIQDNWDLMPYTVGDPTVPLGDFLFDYLDVNGADYDPVLNYYSFAPNTTHTYSNVGFALCGYLVETVTGIPFNTYCNDSIFAPLCMDNTGWFLAEVNEPLVAHPYTYSNGNYVELAHFGYADYPDGQLRTTALSLAKFMYAHMKFGNFGGTQLLDSSTVAYMRSQVVAAIEPSMGVAFFSFVDAYGTWWGHSGGDQGVSTDMYFDEAANTGLLILTNGEGDYGAIRSGILGALDTLQNEYVADIACEILLPTSAVGLVRAREMMLFPNPAHEQVTIVLNGQGMADIDVLDMQGRTAWSTRSNGNDRVQVPMAGLAPGRYTVRVRTGAGISVLPLVRK